MEMSLQLHAGESDSVCNVDANRWVRPQEKNDLQPFNLVVSQIRYGHKVTATTSQPRTGLRLRNIGTRIGLKG